MRRFQLVSCIAVLAFAAFAVGLTVIARGTLAQDAVAAKAGRGEVVMIRCAPEGESFVVRSYQGSPAAPGKRVPSCAESLSVLVKDGFTIHDIGHYDHEGDYALFTLVR